MHFWPRDGARTRRRPHLYSAGVTGVEHSSRVPVCLPVKRYSVLRVPGCASARMVSRTLPPERNSVPTSEDALNVATVHGPRHVPASMAGSVSVSACPAVMVPRHGLALSEQGASADAVGSVAARARIAAITASVIVLMVVNLLPRLIANDSAA